MDKAITFEDMDKAEKKDRILELIKELEDLLTERIVDLHEVKLGVQERHSYIFYRSLLWKIRDKIIKLKP